MVCLQTKSNRSGSSLSASRMIPKRARTTDRHTNWTLSNRAHVHHRVLATVSWNGAVPLSGTGLAAIRPLLIGCQSDSEPMEVPVGNISEAVFVTFCWQKVRER